MHPTKKNPIHQFFCKPLIDSVFSGQTLSVSETLSKPYSNAFWESEYLSHLGLSGLLCKEFSVSTISFNIMATQNVAFWATAVFELLKQ